jgi:O-antigen ligase
MIDTSANSLRAFSAQWLMEHTVYVLLIVVAAVLACIQPLAGIVAALGIFAGFALVGHMRTAVVIFAVLIPYDIQIPTGYAQTLYIDLFVGVLAIPILIDLIKKRTHINYRSLIWLPFLGYALLTTISRTTDARWLLANAVRLMVIIIFSVAVALYGDCKRLIIALGWAMIPVVIYGFYQLITGGPGPFYMYMSGTSTEEALVTMGPEWLNGRAYGFFTHPNAMGSFCAVMAVALLSLAGRSAERKMAIQCYVLSTISVIGLFSSGSRGALMGLAVAVLVLFAISGRKGAIRAVIGLVIILTVLVVAAQYDLLPLARESGLDEFTTEGRLVVWGAALLLFLQHPLIGAGWLSFHQMGVMGDTVYGSANHAHNWYLNTLVESGIVGFFILYVPLIWLFVRNLRVARNNLTALVISVTFTIVLVHDMVDLPIITPQFGLLFGGLIGLAAQTRSKTAYISNAAIS